MGSKARLAKHIAPIIQSYITDKTAGYLEPFVGGANMIQHIKHPKRYGSDINKYLIALLQYSQDLSNTLPETISEDEYNRVKNNKDKYPDWYVGLVGFCSSYGSKFFGGYARDRQKVRDISNQRIRNLEKQRKFLKDIKFKCLPYTDIPKLEGYTIYCDPPYLGTTPYASKFFNHSFFWNWVRDYSIKNVVIVSEFSAPNDFICILEKEVKSMLGNGGISDSKVLTEKLFICKN